MPDDIQNDTQGAYDRTLAGYKKELVALMQKTGAAQFSLNKEFKLASGAMSDHYFDLRLLCGDPDGIGVVAKALYGMIRQLYSTDNHTRPPNTGMPKSVGGLESGSISIAAAISHLSGQLCQTRQKHDTAMPALSSFFVRKHRKEHGTQKMIEGVINDTAVVVDDVITSGGSALRAVGAVRDAGFTCDYLLCIVFRGSNEQKKEIDDMVNMRYLFSADEISAVLRAAS